jgi:putative transposase
MTLPEGPNQRWSLDFVSDALSWRRRFRILAIVDDFTREALALVVDTSISGRRLARELDALIAWRGPAVIVSDNGTEMTSRAILEWINRTGVTGITSRPASHSRTASSRASTVARAMSA